MRATPDTRDLARRSASALGWNGLGLVLRAALQFGVQIAMARWLGPEAYGQAAVALVVIGLAWLLAEGGLGAALVQRPTLTDAEVARATGTVMATSFGVALVLGVGAEPLARALGDAALAPLLWGCAAVVPLQALSNLPSSLLQRQLRLRRLQGLQISGYVFSYGLVGLPLAASGAGAWSLLVAFGLHAAWMLAGGLLSGASLPRPVWRPDRALVAYGARTTAANGVNWALESVDRLFVNRFWGAGALGEYAAAANLSRAPASLVLGAVQPVAFAASARLQEQPQRLQRGYLALLSLALLPSVPIFVSLAWHSPVIVGLLYGTAWAGAAPLLSVLCLGLPAYVVLAVSGPMLRGLDAVGQEFRLQAVALGVLAIGMVAVAGRPVVLAAAVVTGVTALRAALAYRALAQRLQLPPGSFGRCAAGPLALAVLCWLPALALRHHGPGLALMATVLLGPVLSLLLLRWKPRAVLGAPLAQVLCEHAVDSRAAALLCRLAGLAVERAAPGASEASIAP
ncbi:MAG: oligosaccharide flippase family protein [Rubrivivax sp.]